MAIKIVNNLLLPVLWNTPSANMSIPFRWRRPLNDCALIGSPFSDTFQFYATSNDYDIYVLFSPLANWPAVGLADAHLYNIGNLQAFQLNNLAPLMLTLNPNQIQSFQLLNGLQLRGPRYYAITVINPQAALNRNARISTILHEICGHIDYNQFSGRNRGERNGMPSNPNHNNAGGAWNRGGRLSNLLNQMINQYVILNP